MTALLHYRQDRRSLLFILLADAMLLWPHVWPQLWPHLVPHLVQPLPRWPLPLWLAAASLLCFIASIINHNHMHCPMFRRPGFNLAINLALSLARGHSATGIVVPHNMNHHVEAGSSRDWIRPALAGTGWGWLRMLRYVPAASLEMLLQRKQPGAPQLPHQYQTSLRLERGFLYLLVAALLLHDWRVFLLFNLLPWLLGLGLLVGVNLLQHDGCNPGTVLGESRNFVGPIGNWLFFNNGFHSAHHQHPGAHWSTLPARHARLRASLPSADLEHPSILAYLWQFGRRR